MGLFNRSGLAFAAVVVAAVAVASPRAALAQDTVRVGKSVAVAWTFTVMDVGIQAGIFAKHNLKIDLTSYGGDARMQQALTGNNIDIGLGSGPGMGFMAKGVPAKGVAAFAEAPRNIGLLVKTDAPYKTIKDMKGKKFGVTTVGSLTDWLVKRAAVSEGFKVDDFVVVPLGGPEANLAALKTNQIDAVVLAVEACYAVMEKGEGKIIGNFGVYAPKFHTHVIFARNDMQEKRPEVIKRFITAFFETIAYMKANKARTVEITSKVLNFSPEVISRTYDEEIGMLKDDGRFEPEAVKLIKETLPALGILETAPADDVMFTTKFLPSGS